MEMNATERDALLRVMLRDQAAIATLCAGESEAALVALVRLARATLAGAPGLVRGACCGGALRIRVSAANEHDANEAARRVFEQAGDEAMVEVCRRLSDDPADDTLWSTMTTRFLEDRGDETLGGVVG